MGIPYLVRLDVRFFQVEARINEEAERATHYLDESTENRIVEVSSGSVASGGSRLLTLN